MGDLTLFELLYVETPGMRVRSSASSDTVKKPPTGDAAKLKLDAAILKLLREQSGKSTFELIFNQDKFTRWIQEQTAKSFKLATTMIPGRQWRSDLPTDWLSTLAWKRLDMRVGLKNGVHLAKNTIETICVGGTITFKMAIKIMESVWAWVNFAYEQIRDKVSLKGIGETLGYCAHHIKKLLKFYYAGMGAHGKDQYAATLILFSGLLSAFGIAYYGPSVKQASEFTKEKMKDFGGFVGKKKQDLGAWTSTTYESTKDFMFAIPDEMSAVLELAKKLTIDVQNHQLYKRADTEFNFYVFTKELNGYRHTPEYAGLSEIEKGLVDAGADKANAIMSDYENRADGSKKLASNNDNDLSIAPSQLIAIHGKQDIRKQKFFGDMQAVVQSLPKGRYTLPLRNAMVNVDVMGWLSRPVSLYQTVYDMFYILMKGRLGRRIVLERRSGMVKGICPVDADEGCQARIGMIEQLLDNEFGKDLALAGIIDGEMVEDSTLMDKFISQAKATAEQYESDATKAEQLLNSFWNRLPFRPAPGPEAVKKAEELRGDANNARAAYNCLFNLFCPDMTGLTLLPVMPENADLPHFSGLSNYDLPYFSGISPMVLHDEPRAPNATLPDLELEKRNFSRRKIFVDVMGARRTVALTNDVWVRADAAYVQAKIKSDDRILIMRRETEKRDEFGNGWSFAPPAALEDAWWAAQTAAREHSAALEETKRRSNQVQNIKEKLAAAVGVVAPLIVPVANRLAGIGAGGDMTSWDYDTDDGDDVDVMVNAKITLFVHQRALDMMTGNDYAYDFATELRV